MNIKGKNKAKILAALYNNAKSFDMGILEYDSHEMLEYEAQKLLDTGQTYFDYVKGRCIKIDLSTNNLRTDLYNRDYGKNAAEDIINNISE